MIYYREVDVEKDMRKLRRMLKTIPADRKVIAEKLIEEIGFMGSTLAALKKTVQERGAVEDFKQGKQHFMRESPALKAYGTIVQRYGMIYKQVADLLPKPEPVDKLKDQLMEFLQNQKDAKR